MKEAAILTVQSGKSNDPDWMMFNLCREFRCLPSQIEKEDWFIMEKFVQYIVHIRKFEKAELDKSKNRARRGRR